MKALRCIKSNDTDIEDPYKLAVLAYALRLADDPDKISIFNKLRNLEIRAGKEWSSTFGTLSVLFSRSLSPNQKYI